jgi:hypothetical protein
MSPTGNSPNTLHHVTCSLSSRCLHYNQWSWKSYTGGAINNPIFLAFGDRGYIYPESFVSYGENVSAWEGSGNLANLLLLGKKAVLYLTSGITNYRR